VQTKKIRGEFFFRRTSSSSSSSSVGVGRVSYLSTTEESRIAASEGDDDDDAALTLSRRPPSRPTSILESRHYFGEQGRAVGRVGAEPNEGPIAQSEAWITSKKLFEKVARPSSSSSSSTAVD